MLTIKRGKDKRTVHALVINLADLPDGVTLASADLVAGTPVKEGSIIGVDATTGIAHLLKTAVVAATVGSDATTYNVAKGSHFKVGDFVMKSIGSTAVSITAIDRDSSTLYDTITVSDTLGAANAGVVLKQASAAASKGALKYNPSALLAEGYDVEGGTNIFVAAVTIGQYKQALVSIDADLKTALKDNNVFINFV